MHFHLFNSNEPHFEKSSDVEDPAIIQKRLFIELNCICITILLYLGRTAIPFLKFPFLVFFSGLMIYTFILHRNEIIVNAKEFIRDYLLWVTLFLILLLSFLLSNKIYLIIFKDVVNSIILFSFFYLLMFYVKSVKDLKTFIKALINLFLIFAIIISIILIDNFFDFSNRNIVKDNAQFNWNYVANFLSYDYNFALLPVFFGIIASIYMLFEGVLGLKKGLLNLGLVLFLVCIAFSGSRRGIIALSAIIFIVIYIQIVRIFKNKMSFKIAVNQIGWFVISFFIIFFSLWYFSYKASGESKFRIVNMLGSDKVLYSKAKFAAIMSKYSTIIKGNNTFESVYDRIWKYDDLYSNNPDQGWGKRIHKTIYPLVGKNAEIVPSGVKGYLLDSTTDGYINKNTIYSRTNIKTLNIKKGETIHASVYCYATEDFNGDSLGLFAEGENINNIYSSYRLNDLVNKEDKLVGNLFYNGDFSKNKENWTTSSDSTYQEIIKTPFGNGLRVTRGNGKYGYWSLLYSGRPIIYYANHLYQIIFKVKVIKGDNIPFNVGWWTIDDEPGYNPYALPLKITKLENGWNEIVCSYRFRKKQYNLTTFLNTLQRNSIIEIASVEMKDLNRNDSLPFFIDQEKDSGKWKKLELKVPDIKGNVSIYLGFRKNNVTDFTSLKGFTVFALPQYELVKKTNNRSSFEDKESNFKIDVLETNYFGDSINLNFNNKSQNNLFEVHENNFVVTEVSQRKVYYVTLLPKLEENLDFLKIIKYHIDSIFYIQSNKDPIREWASKFISEDSTYLGYGSHFIVDTISDQFTSARLIRWRFAVQLFTKEYKWNQKLFGGGFKFLNWYGNYFYGDKNKSDYPHNPFLSILLYSGIFGLIIYLSGLFQVFKYYLKFKKDFQILFIFFMVTFFFSFFSGGSPLDPPMMGFFIILPVYIHNVFKKHQIK